MATSLLQRHRIAAVLCSALFVFAFVAAPHSCEWGLDAYFWAGIAAALLLAAAPFTRWSKPAASTPLLQSLLDVGTVAAVWVAGLLVADVRIMCRLF